jgi:hypothetical protein
MNTIVLRTETEHVADSPILAAQLMVKKFIKKVDRLLTAIAYAEAGNLDAVQEMLDQDRAAKNK